jgi:hypothetical protein
MGSPFLARSEAERGTRRGSGQRRLPALHEQRLHAHGRETEELLGRHIARRANQRDDSRRIKRHSRSAWRWHVVGETRQLLHHHEKLLSFEGIEGATPSPRLDDINRGGVSAQPRIRGVSREVEAVQRRIGFAPLSLWRADFAPPRRKSAVQHLDLTSYLRTTDRCSSSTSPLPIAGTISEVQRTSALSRRAHDLT